jgi:hypothetical protein
MSSSFLKSGCPQVFAHILHFCVISSLFLGARAPVEQLHVKVKVKLKVKLKPKSLGIAKTSHTLNNLNKLLPV